MNSCAPDGARNVKEFYSCETSFAITHSPADHTMSKWHFRIGPNKSVPHINQISNPVWWLSCGYVRKGKKAAEGTKEKVGANRLLLAGWWACDRKRCAPQNATQQLSEPSNVCCLRTEKGRQEKKEARGGKVDWKVRWQIRQKGRHLHAGLDAVALAFSGGSLRALSSLRYKSNSVFTAKGDCSFRAHSETCLQYWILILQTKC